MRKLAISIAITSVLGLSACGDTSLEDVQKQTEMSDQRVRVVFDPSNGELSVPNDLLLSGTIDGTLEMPDETSAKDAGEAVDFSNPSAALGALDGWGTQNSFSIALEYEDEDLTIDATTITSSDAVAIYQVEKFPSTTDSDCTNTDYSGLICKGIAQLTYGEDYVTSMSGDDLVVVLVKPLQAGASYAVALTNTIKDSNGNDLMPSSTYASVEQDIETTPLVLPSLADSELNETQAGIRLLQTLTNNFENSLVSAFSADKDKIVYTQVFTTQSAGVAGTDPLQITKLLNAQALAKAKAEDASSVATAVTDSTYSVSDIIGVTGLGYEAVNYYTSSITVPYYLDFENSLTGRWEAACDSGAILASLSAEQLAAGTAGDNNATCAALGLADLGFDTQRHLTKYNPLPETKSEQTVKVQVTTPDEALLAGVDAKPTAGWPVVILQHGITSKKEDMLAVTAALSSAGFATVAIDHPLHGERGVKLEDGNWINATNGALEADGETEKYPGNSATHYLNLSSLLTARDNLRQSVADTLKLRLAINTMYDAAAPTTQLFDTTKVYYLGHSLGAITGTMFTTVANTPANTGDETTDATVDALYALQGSVLVSPGSSIGNFLLESKAFSPLIKASVVYGLGNELTDALQANIADLTTVVGTNLARGADASSYCSAVYASVVASETPAQSDGLVCAYDELVNNASDEELAAIQAGLTQYAFAAQALLEAGDPSNYASLLSTLQTPVLMFEVVGDGKNNPSDLVIPNTVSTDPYTGIAGTTGLANQLSLEQITETKTQETSFSGIVRFNYGSHSSILSPYATGALDDLNAITTPAYTTLFAAVTSEMQTMATTFFATDAKSVPVSNDAKTLCIVNGYVDDTCTED
jgi:Pla-1/cef family extracellular lipase